MNIADRKQRIKLFIADVDGTMTDGRINVSESGEAFKSFNVKDGYGIGVILSRYNIIPVIITGRSSDIVDRRAKELKIVEVYQGVKNKNDVLSDLCAKYRCNLSEVAFIGDDLPDLECMKKCGISGCPADAVDPVKSISNFVSTKNGGDGAVREFIDWLTENTHNSQLQ